MSRSPLLSSGTAVLIGSLPPATFGDWRYLAVAAAGGLIAFVSGRRLERLNTPITVLDAAGLSLFAVTGASKAIGFGVGPAQAVLLGAITGVGGGTLRDVLVRQIPSVAFWSTLLHPPLDDVDLPIGQRTLANELPHRLRPPGRHEAVLRDAASDRGAAGH